MHSGHQLSIPERIGLQGRAGFFAHAVAQHGGTLLHHARDPIGLFHLAARSPARPALLSIAAKVALRGSKNLWSGSKVLDICSCYWSMYEGQVAVHSCIMTHLHGSHLSHQITEACVR